MQDTTKNNALIAEFMGYRVINSGENPWWYNNVLKYKINDFKYHTSWEWLMPVVEKIESLNYAFGISNHEAYTCHRQNDTNGDFEDVKSNKIDSVYSVVMQFITWYNSQPNQS